jgi:hypothetical protein
MYLFYHIFTTLHMIIFIVLPLFFVCLEFYFREARLSLCIVLSVSIRFAASDYFFDIFKLFLRSSRSKKGRQSNGKNKHDKGTNNDVQNTTQKEKKIEQHESYYKSGARSDEQFLLHKLYPFCCCLMARSRIAISIAQCTIEAYKLLYIGDRRGRNRMIVPK